jgi:hypothetical protein
VTTTAPSICKSMPENTTRGADAAQVRKVCGSRPPKRKLEMANRTKPNGKASPAVHVTAVNGESAQQAIARALLDPVLLAGSFLSDMNKQAPHGGPDAFITELRKHARAVTTGDLSRLEEMLAAQAHTLDGLFYSLALRSRSNLAAGYIDTGESYMKLALRAQAQCRATVESVATIKNPPAVAFVRQANIAAGPQQVNNTSALAVASSRAEDSENPPNKLLEAKDGERLDTRTTSSAGGANPHLEAVGAINRTKDIAG